MNVTIVGGGIAGLTTGIALKNNGLSCTVFEAAPEIREVGAGIGLSANAIRVFERLGIADDIIAHGNLLASLTIRNRKGKALSRTDSQKVSQKYGTDNFTIHRALLQEELVKHNSGNAIVTGKKVVGFFQSEDSVTLIFEDGTSHSTKYLIVADGIHSPIRQKLIPGSSPRYAGYTCWRAVIDNPGSVLNESSETWGTNGRFGIVPLAGNKLYWYAVVNAKQNDPAMKAVDTDWILNHFKNYHDPIFSIIQHTKNEQLIHNDICDLKPIDQYAFGRVLLIGDAAHATTPNMGQGACQAIEDAFILSQELMGREPEKAFKSFEQRRIERTHWIINSSEKIGKVAQIGNPVLGAIRNAVLRMIPKSFNEKQTAKLLGTDF